MIKFLLAVLLFSTSTEIFAQNEGEIVGHCDQRRFILKKEDYYIVEMLGNTLKSTAVKYDTLIAQLDNGSIFKGQYYLLKVQKDGKYLSLINRKNKTQKVEVIDEPALEKRRHTHNFYYYHPYEMAISQYSGLLRKKNYSEYRKYDDDRTEMYKKHSELEIEDFKKYFTAFLAKYNIKRGGH